MSCQRSYAEGCCYLSFTCAQLRAKKTIVILSGNCLGDMLTND